MKKTTCQYKITCVLFILLLFISCSSKKLDGFCFEAWNTDKKGCNSTRLEQIEYIVNQQDKLLAISQNNMKKLLGKPDLHQLYSRNQKFFIYFLEPAESCENNQKLPQVLEIRFNAMGLSTEVLVKRWIISH